MKNMIFIIVIHFVMLLSDDDFETLSLKKRKQQAATKIMISRIDNKVSTEKVVRFDFEIDNVKESLAKLSHVVLSKPPPMSINNS
ncbi:hypothetical protein HAX54_034312 [Datura stramonium]|uniref:Uncharacterized protein n=1 Tax=Datura stramonium TaxID=4076 RepID=A0ABS8VH05_DATST|nr:hypothetical protein [Datura stramonium]